MEDLPLLRPPLRTGSDRHRPCATTTGRWAKHMSADPLRGRSPEEVGHSYFLVVDGPAHPDNWMAEAVSFGSVDANDIASELWL